MRLTSKEKAVLVRKAKNEYYYFQNFLTSYKCDNEFKEFCKKQMNKCVDRLRTLGHYELVYV